jgi:hypothetical protein
VKTIIYRVYDPDASWSCWFVSEEVAEHWVRERQDDNDAYRKTYDWARNLNVTYKIVGIEIDMTPEGVVKLLNDLEE